MRGYLASQAPWRMALLQGLFFVAWMTGWNTVTSHIPLLPALLGAAVAGAMFVPVEWYLIRRQDLKLTWVVGPLPAGQKRAVVAAAATGEPPADRALVPAAAAVARFRLQQNVEFRSLTLFVFAVVGAVLAIVIAFHPSIWCVLGLVAVVALLIQTARYPTIQRRRIAALEAASMDSVVTR